MWILTVPSLWSESLETDVLVSYSFTVDYIITINLFNNVKILCCRFFFDFSLTYIGAGMICSHIVNLSLLLGAVVSWGIMWPLISELRGEWYSSSLPESSMSGLQGYKVHH